MHATAKLMKHRGSARKARLVADLIRGKEVNEAYNILTYTRKGISPDMRKLLMSAISNWEAKNELRSDNYELKIQEIFVNEGKTLKRFQPAPFGRAYRIRKRYAHITITVGGDLEEDVAEEVIEETDVVEEVTENTAEEAEQTEE